LPRQGSDSNPLARPHAAKTGESPQNISCTQMWFFIYRPDFAVDNRGAPRMTGFLDTQR
jgi:hypothetical protein